MCPLGLSGRYLCLCVLLKRNFRFVSVDYAKISLKTRLSEHFLVRLQSGAEFDVSELHRLNSGSKYTRQTVNVNDSD